MATYSPDQLGIKAPPGGFQQGGWYQGRQYWGGTLSDPGVIHPSSNQIGAGQAVSKEVNAQSAAAQGVSPQQFESYLQTQRDQGAGAAPAPDVGFGKGSVGLGGPGTGSGAGGAITPTPTLNLPELYNNLYSSSGITDLEKKYSDEQKRLADAKASINDNPFLSEADRVGRVNKLESLFQDRTANIKNDIATKKADIETQLNLQTKQFDINSQAAQQALSQFNSLLQMGALDNASGEDIANITRSTGLSSSAIYSAIKATQDKNTPTQVITSTADDGTVTASVINTKTGAIVSKTSLGAIGNAQGTGGGSSSTAATKEVKAQFINDANSATGGSIFPRLVQAYAPYMSLQDIYTLYATSTTGKKYGTPIEDPSKIQAIYANSRGK